MNLYTKLILSKKLTTNEWWSKIKTQNSKLLENNIEKGDLRLDHEFLDEIAKQDLGINKFIN